jgi:hypothetical protein
MNKVKSLVCALMLFLFLSTSVLGGEIHIPAPTPPPDPACLTPSSDDYPAEDQGAMLSSPVTDVALNVLQHLLVLF